jgi:glycosyltransferase involved in cell wall biosynthesis
MAGSAGPPTLSVVVLTHNYGRFLGQCIESILGQTYGDFELIVFDDGSADDSREVAERYAGDERVRVVSQSPALGFGGAMRAAANLCRGRYRVTVDADDYVLAADAFERQLEVMEADAEVSVCFAGHWKVGAGVSDERRLAGVDAVWEGREFLRQFLLRPNFSVSQTGAVIRSEAYREAGGFAAGLRHYLDFRMWVALSGTGKAAYVDGMLYAYRMHGGQYSSGMAVADECVTSVRWAAGVARGMGLAVTDEQALRARIGDPALADAFANRRRVALRKAMYVLRREPRAALGSMAWRVAVVRAVLGARGWRLMVRVRGARRSAAA